MIRACAAALLSLSIAFSMACSSYRRDAGTGDVAFRLAWNGETDLDLFVEDRAGTCTYFGQRESESGALLDIDCNSGTGRLCEKPVENVYWPLNAAPTGRYRFWVHAHAIIPSEAPVEYEVQVLNGPRMIWASRAAMTAHEELHGPFVYRFPGQHVWRSSAGESLACSGALPSGIE